MHLAQYSDATACDLAAHSVTSHDVINPASTTVMQSRFIDVTHVKLDEFTRTAHQFNGRVHLGHCNGPDTSW